MNNKEIINYIWSISNFYGNTLVNIFDISENYPLEATSLLFTQLESIARNVVNNFEDKTIEIYNKLFKEGYLDKNEFEFLNDNNFSIRIIRNKLLHKNISKYNFISIENDQEILYPFNEESTWKNFITIYSNPLLKICYNLLCNDLLGFSKLETFADFRPSFIRIKTLKPEEIMC